MPRAIKGNAGGNGEGNGGKGTGKGGQGIGNEGGSVGSDGPAQTLPSAPLPWGTGPDGRARKRRSRGLWSDLPRALDNLTVLGMRALQDVLKLPVGSASAAELRSIVTAGLGVMGHKIRVDEGALRVRHDNDVLERLEPLIKEARKVWPREQADKLYTSGFSPENLFTFFVP